MIHRESPRMAQFVQRIAEMTGSDAVTAAEGVRRRLFVTLFVSLLIPVQIYFTYQTGVEGDVAHTLFNGAFAVVLIVFIAFVLRVARPEPLYYAVLLTAAVLFTFLVMDPAEGAGRLTWLFLYVPVATIAVGRWPATALGGALLLMVHVVRSGLVPGGLVIGDVQFFRFNMSFLILAGVVHIAEYARERTHNSLLREHRELQKAHEELGAANEQIRLLSITDALTGAYNRQFLDDRLPAEIERARRYTHELAAVICDIDHFKAFNDTFGHQAGDALLRHFADTLSQAVRQEIDWVARYGGEEFLIVLPETGLEPALVVAERLRARVELLSVPWQGADLTCTASFGVAALQEPGWDADKLVRAADRSLYLAKERGRNCVVAGALG